MRLLELADRFGSGAVEAARSRAAPTAPEPNTAVPPRTRLVALRTHRWAALPRRLCLETQSVHRH